MATRRELFNAKNPPAESAGDLVKSTVNYMFSGNAAKKKKGELRKLSADEKMLCALRKVLAQMSNDGAGTRYFIDGAQVRVLNRTDSEGAKAGEPSTYHRQGTCRLGLAHKTGEASYKMASFEVSYRDTVDTLGLPDVTYFDPTSIEELPAGSQL